jgi:hypothetical protein
VTFYFVEKVTMRFSKKHAANLTTPEPRPVTGD